MRKPKDLKINLDKFKLLVINSENNENVETVLIESYSDLFRDQHMIVEVLTDPKIIKNFHTQLEIDCELAYNVKFIIMNLSQINHLSLTGKPFDINRFLTNYVKKLNSLESLKIDSFLSNDLHLLNPDELLSLKSISIRFVDSLEKIYEKYFKFLLSLPRLDTLSLIIDFRPELNTIEIINKNLRNLSNLKNFTINLEPCWDIPSYLSIFSETLNGTTFF